MSTAAAPETASIAAWLRAGELQAEGIRTEPYDPARFRAALRDLRAATRLPVSAWQPSLVETCAAAGVAVVFVPDLPKTRCHAVSWWVTRTRAVIQLGLRYKTDDQVWFSFFHESAHLLLDDGRRSGINDLTEDPSAEARANAFAADLLIAPDEYAAFIARGRPTKSRVVEFADRIGIAPSIVVGRLQHDGVVPFNHMQALKTPLDWTA